MPARNPTPSKRLSHRTKVGTLELWLSAAERATISRELRVQHASPSQIERWVESEIWKLCQVLEIAPSFDDEDIPF